MVELLRYWAKVSAALLAAITIVGLILDPSPSRAFAVIAPWTTIVGLGLTGRGYLHRDEGTQRRLRDALNGFGSRRDRDGVGYITFTTEVKVTLSGGDFVVPPRPSGPDATVDQVVEWVEGSLEEVRHETQEGLADLYGEIKGIGTSRKLQDDEIDR